MLTGTFSGAPRDSRRGTLARQTPQVGGGVLVEPQNPGQRFEHLRRGVAVAALLQAQVVVGADARERSDLLAAQAGHPAQPVRGEAGVLDLYNLANRQDDALLDRCAAENIAHVPFFPLGGYNPLQSAALAGVADRLGASRQQPGRRDQDGARSWCGCGPRPPTRWTGRCATARCAS
ncbi:hypothetical protein GCM10009733_065670 [Nonomuraea maheshkhaliensis]|uniref:Uncharacterized protein n=1 Tax=Nonomuraea maheshkhaliensis TaxID=419590 RepID=A0ABP4RP34_9ACTN